MRGSCSRTQEHLTQQYEWHAVAQNSTVHCMRTVHRIEHNTARCMQMNTLDSASLTRMLAKVSSVASRGISGQLPPVDTVAPAVSAEGPPDSKGDAPAAAAREVQPAVEGSGPADSADAEDVQVLFSKMSEVRRLPARLWNSCLGVWNPVHRFRSARDAAPGPERQHTPDVHLQSGRHCLL